ncbi:MAG TPA: peptidylprolyl isomerase [Sedimentisphaerales bacterium]|nr:peptidylprolyl isomerase [Sedimentisphaerales bacterium]
MAQAKTGDRVRVFYTGKLDDGTVFDSNFGGDALEFTVGSGELIGGFDKAVIGMSAGDATTIRISPEDAYGQRLEERVVVLSRKELPSGLDPGVGQHLRFGSPDGAVTVLVTAATEESITVDGNHPLAGKSLTFEIELAAIG